MAQSSPEMAFQKSVECVVCVNAFNLDVRIPTAFPCLHTVCKVCVGKIPQGHSISCPICKQSTKVSKLITNFGVVDILEKLCQSCNSRVRAAKCEHCEKQVCDSCLEAHAQDFYVKIKEKLDELRATIRRTTDMSLDEAIQDQEILRAEKTIADIQKSMQLHLDAFIEGHRQLQVIVKQYRDANIAQDMMWRRDIISRSDIEGCKQFLRTSKDALGTRYSVDCTKQMLAKLNTEASKLLKQLQDLQTSVPRPTQYTFVTSQSPTPAIGHIVIPSSISSRPSPTPVYDYTRARCTAMIGSGGSEPEQFCRQGYVACIRDRYIVSDTDNHRLKVYDSKLNLMVILGEQGDNNLQFKHPMGLCAGRNDELFVCDTNNNRIKVYNKYLQVVGQFGSGGAGDNEFFSPRALAVASTGDLLVCDACNYRVKVHKSDGSYVRSIGSRGSGMGQFTNYPVSVAVTPGDNVLVIERGTACLHVFSINGDYVRRITPSVPGSPVGIKMWGCTADPSGNIIVTDRANHRLIVLNAEGKFVCTIGSRGLKPGELDEPWSVALNVDNKHIIVYEYGNKRIQLFQT